MIYITQPTYLSGLYFYSLLLKSKKVVFLDDVEFNERSWQQRNKIYKKNSFEYLTVPIKKSGMGKQKINQVEVFDKMFFDKHLKTIQHTYSQTKYFQKVFQELKNLENIIKNTNKLVKINILLIKTILDLLGEKVDFMSASELNIQSKRSHKLINICKKLNFSKILSNQGSKEYLDEDKNLFIESNIELIFYKYEAVKYNHVGDKFIPNLSIIDLLFNEGPNSNKIIRQGLKNL